MFYKLRKKFDAYFSIFFTEKVAEIFQFCVENLTQFVIYSYFLNSFVCFLYCVEFVII